MADRVASYASADVIQSTVVKKGEERKVGGHNRSHTKRKGHTERLHRQAVLALSIEDLCFDLGLNLSSFKRHKSWEYISNYNGTQFSSIDKIGKEMRT